MTRVSEAAARAQALLRGRLLEWEGGMNRDDRTPVEWLVRRYHAMDREEAAALAQACAAALRAPEAALRAGALRFFADTPEAGDDGALLRAWRDHRADFDGVPDPWVPELGRDLGAQLARVVAARVRAGDTEAVTLLQREALSPGRAGPVIAALFYLDLPWVEAHAAEIVKGSPGALKAVLYNLQRRGRPVLSLIQALAASLPASDLREAVQAELPPPLREQALAALPP